MNYKKVNMMGKNWKNKYFMVRNTHYNAVNMMGKKLEKMKYFMVRNMHYNAVNMMGKNGKNEIFYGEKYAL